MARPAGAVLWFFGTCLVAAAPLVYFASGASDAGTERDRLVAAAPVLALAWATLAFSLRLWGTRHPVRSASLLLVVAGALELLAQRLAGGPALHGDGAWVAYWIACAGLWLWLSRVALRRTENG